MKRIICQDCGGEFITCGSHAKRCSACRTEYNRTRTRQYYVPARREDRKRRGLNFDPRWLYSQITPGMTKGDITRLVGRSDKNADALLATLEYQGYLLSEDNGRIYPFGRTA